MTRARVEEPLVEGTFPVALVGRVRNGYIQAAVQQYGSCRRLADAAGLSYSTLINWLNMTEAPGSVLLSRDEFKQKCVQFFGATVDEVFPEAVRRMNLTRALSFCVRKDVDLRLLEAYQPRMLPEADPIACVFDTERRELIADALKVLTPNERKVLEMRFGMNDCDPMIYEECGRVMQLTRERIRQIERKAIRKVRDHIEALEEDAAVKREPPKRGKIDWRRIERVLGPRASA